MTRGRRASAKAVGIGIFVVALLLAGVVSFYASSAPDGLNRVAQDQGFSSTEREHGTADGPLAGYSSKGVDDQRLSGGLAGVIGVVVVLVLAGGLTLVLRRRRRTDAEGDDADGPARAARDQQVR